MDKVIVNNEVFMCQTCELFYGGEKIVSMLRYAFSHIVLFGSILCYQRGIVVQFRCSPMTTAAAAAAPAVAATRCVLTSFPTNQSILNYFILNEFQVK